MSQQTETTESTAEPTAVEPRNGAGLFDVDLDQSNVSQDPNVAVKGDIAALPDEWEL